MTEIDRYEAETGEVRLLETGTRIATDTARWGLRLASIPVQPLPATLRAGIFDTARLMIGTAALVPRLAVRSFSGLAEEIDDLESRTARREDLGRRVDRETRRLRRRNLDRG